MPKRGKPRSRANGEGTIYQNANETWTAQYKAPPGSKPARPSMTFTTQRKAKQWLTSQLRDLDTGDYVELSIQSLGSWWDVWVETYKRRTVTEDTLASYKYAKARLSAAILKTQLADLKTENIQAEWNRLSDLDLTRRTVELTRTPLVMCLDKAVDLKKLRSNPAKATTLPDDDSTPSVPLTIDEERDLVAYCLSLPRTLANGRIDKHDVRRQVYKDALLFILRTGVRRAECLNLTWDDWTDLVIHVRGTKTDASDRMIPLTEDVLAMLRRRRQATATGYVFVTTNGHVLSGRNLLRHLVDLNGHKIHDLRHTYCTRAAQAGINPKVLQTITGHSKIETLLKIYTHVSDQDRADAAAKIFAYCKFTANPAPNADAVSK